MKQLRLTLLILIFSVLFSGCGTPGSSTEEQNRFTLRDALDLARQKHLEVNAFETVRLTAAEYQNHNRALYLEEVIRDGRGHTISSEIIRNYLEDAIIFNHLLGGVPPSQDLVQLQSVRSGQLLDHAVAVAAVKLQSAIQLYELGDPSERQNISDGEMELRNLTGASPVDIARMDLSALPEPYPLKHELIVLQQFAAFNRPESAGSAVYPELLSDVKWAFANTRLLQLQYAHILYNIQNKLNSRSLKNAADYRKAARLANAVGIVLLLEEDFKTLNKAYDSYRLVELKFRLEKVPSLELQKKLIRLRLDWLTAWLKLRTTLGVTDFEIPIPELQEQPHPELTAESALLFEILPTRGGKEK